MSSTKQRKNKERDVRSVTREDKIAEPSTQFDGCSRCYMTVDNCVNMTRFTFSCDHWFHMECYEIMRLNFGGSMCPICFRDRRFDDVQMSIYTEGSEDRLDIDHHYGVLCSELFYQKKTKGDMWTNIEQRSDHGFMMKLSRTDIEKYGDYECNDRNALLMKSKHAIGMDLKQETVNKIRKLFDDQKPVHSILSMKYTTEDIIVAGITMEYLIQREYTLKDIYDLGFRTYQDLLKLKMHSRLATLFYEGNKPFVPIQLLVDYYRIDYQVLIKMFCYDFNGNIKNDVVSYQKAVLEFCKLNLSKDELIKLKMNNINALISCFGPNCFTAECMVELCNGHDVNDVDTLMDIFMFDSDTMKKICGFNNHHFEMLEWDRSHPLRKAIQIKEDEKPKQHIVKKHSSSDEDDIKSDSFGTDTSGSDDGEDSGDGDMERPIPIQQPKTSVFSFESTGFMGSSVLPSIHTSPFASSSNSSMMSLPSTSYDTDAVMRPNNTVRRPMVKREKLT
jgi:hypothetical protein